MKHIPASHLDLIDGPYTVALTTVMPDGQPQTTPVWCNRTGDYILINVMKGFRKEENMRLNPKVTLLAYDPSNPERNIEIRGCVVEVTEDGAVQHDDELVRLYLGKPDAKFFGDAVAYDRLSITAQALHTSSRLHIFSLHQWVRKRVNRRSHDNSSAQNSSDSSGNRTDDMVYHPTCRERTRGLLQSTLTPSRSADQFYRATGRSESTCILRR